MKVRKRKNVARGAAVEDKTSFLSRWAQRKAEQKNNPEPVESEPTTIKPDETTLSTQDEPEAAVLTDEDMPDVETLNETSDFSQFFSSGVSEELRNLALQKLFRLPEFNLRDGLNDYDEDFSKMPELTEAVASKLRNWVEEQKEDFKEQLADEGSEETEKESVIEADERQVQFTEEDQEVDEDDLGDADLDG
jgi:hypothetical protein